MDGNSSLYNRTEPGPVLTINVTGESTAINDKQDDLSNFAYYSDYEFKIFLYEAFDFERPIYLFIWEILIIFTTLFNVLVIIVLLRKKMRNVIHTVLVVIAITDSMTGMVTLPTYIYTYSSYPEYGGGIIGSSYPQYDEGKTENNYYQYKYETVPQYDEGKTENNYYQYKYETVPQYDEGKTENNYYQYKYETVPQYDEGKTENNYYQYKYETVPQYDEGKTENNYYQYKYETVPQYDKGKTENNYSQYEYETVPQYDEVKMTSMDVYELDKHWCNAFMVSKYFLSRSFHNISIWLTVFLGVQRFASVRFPFKSQRIFTVKNAFIFIGIVSVLSPILHIYHLIYLKADVKSGFCHWTLENGWSLFHVWSSLLFMHLIPCILLVVLTTLMICHLRTSASHVMREGSSRSMVDRRRAWNKRMSIIVSTIVIVLLIPEIPYGIFLLFTVIQVHSKEEIMPLNVNRAFHAGYEILLVLSFHANYWIYTILNKRFRSELKSTFKEVFNFVCRFVGKPSRKFSITSTSFSGGRTTDSFVAGKSGKKLKRLGRSSSSDSKSERGSLKERSSETAENEERV